MSTTHSSPPRVRRVRRSAVIGATLAAALVGWAVPAAAQPAEAAFPAQVPPTPVAFDLYAVSGTTTLPGLTTAVNVWGYRLDDAGTDGAGVTRPGGPTLVVHQDDEVTITLHNQLSETNSLVVRGQSMRTDRVGAAARVAPALTGGTQIYTFTPKEVGTFLYEAGPLANSPHQVAMGLYGAFVVLPSSGTPYGSDSDATVLISEIDPALNGSAQPAVFDMRKFAPKYTLVNGTPYPVTAQLGTPAAGDDVLLRYVNAGISYHSMSVLGANQRIVADDGHTLAQPYSVVAQTVGPGQTTDAVLHVSVNAAAGTKLAVFDGNLQVRNRNRRPATTTAAVTYGGAMAFLEVAGTVNTADTTGPVASNLVATNTSINAHISDVTTGGSNVTAAEYSIDGGPSVAFGGTFGAPEVDVTATFAAIAGGSHTIRVRGQDQPGNWGPWASVVVSNDNVGPISTGLKLTPNPANGLVTVALHATGSDAGRGGSNVKSAEYTIDEGTPTATTAAMTVGAAAVTTSLDATIPAGLAEGDHPITVRVTDAFDNTGPPSSIVLTIDNSGPATSAVVVSPNVTNGTVGVNSSTPAVRVTASATDPVSNIVAAEGFIDTAGPAGTGFIFLPSDGAWNAKTEGVTVDIPLTTIAALPAGVHQIVVRAKDAAGNWGVTATGALTIDKTSPTVTGIALADPTPTSAPSVAFSVTFSEPVTGVTAANFALAGTAPGTAITSVTGSGATRTVTVSTGTVGGTLGLNLTTTGGVKDVAGNALSATGVPFTGPLYTILTPPLYFSTAGNSNPPGAPGTADDADIYYWNGVGFSRAIDVTTISNPLPAGANVDGLDRVDDTHFYLSFNGTTTIAVPGPDLTVQDEDVVYYNAGTWSVFFDGTPTSRGLSNSDVDAISVVGSTLYFSLDDNDIPTGVIGTGDDADIYSWNGTSMARVINASGLGSLGWSSNNVDGVVWIDATHLYLSYSDTTTAVAGLGNVEDEDVVYYNAGVWSVYFDGTVKGLTATNHDVDAFDLP